MSTPYRAPTGYPEDWGLERCYKERRVIGDCTLYLGDSREILPALDDVDALVTDPPYGVNIGDHHGANEHRAGLLVKGGYESYVDSVSNFIDVVVPIVADAIAKAKRSVVFGVPPNIWKLPAPSAMGGVFVSGAVGRNKWGWSTLIHCCFYGTAARLNEGAKPTAIINNDAADKTGHPTTKPTSWMAWAVDLASAPGETVLDPFLGSGTTGVACARLGRRFIGIEIEPKYFDIACQRIEKAYQQADMFIERPKAPKQEPML